MKRSEINALMSEAEQILGKANFKLPPWAFWSPEDWKSKGSECDEIRHNRLGWDLTDFGSGDFLKTGLLLFTIRNGGIGSKRWPKPYAEKIMISKEGQVTPLHFHWSKREDIINRDGGTLVMKLWKAGKDEELSDESFTVQVDGVTRRLNPGGELRLAPGESVCLEPYLYHKFWAEGGLCVVGEVSMVNDDANDNRFHGRVGRFPSIDEDAKPLHLLCTEYPKG